MFSCNPGDPTFSACRELYLTPRGSWSDGRRLTKEIAYPGWDWDEPDAGEREDEEEGLGLTCKRFAEWMVVVVRETRSPQLTRHSQV